MAFYNNFESYFEDFARNDVDINHTDTERHFYRIDIEEVLTGQTYNANTPFLSLENYQFGFSDARSDNIQKIRKCAFFVMCHVADNGDFDAISSAYNRAEQICDRLLNLMENDKRTRINPLVKDFGLETVQGDAITDKVNGNYGFRVYFELKTPHNIYD